MIQRQREHFVSKQTVIYLLSDLLILKNRWRVLSDRASVCCHVCISVIRRRQFIYSTCYVLRASESTCCQVLHVTCYVLRVMCYVRVCYGLWTDNLLSSMRYGICRHLHTFILRNFSCVCAKFLHGAL